MASQLAEPGLTFEIGAGSGFSTLALLKAGHRVVGLDQNIYQLQKAEQRLIAAGYSTKLVERVEIRSDGDGGGKWDYRHVDIPLDGEQKITYLLEGDAEQVNIRGDWTKKKDSTLVGMFRQIKFDYMVLWLPGTGIPFPANPTKDLPGIFNAKLHFVRNAFELAFKLLKKGGLIQFVDRISPDGGPDNLHRYYKTHGLGFIRHGSSERISSLESYSGVKLHASKASEDPTEIKLISMIYQKPNPKAD